jgi:hypothetical protein
LEREWGRGGLPLDAGELEEDLLVQLYPPLEDPQQHLDRPTTLKTSKYKQYHPPAYIVSKLVRQLL